MGVRRGHTAEVVENKKTYLQSHPANYYSSEFKAIINPLDKILRSLVDTDEEADEYMNIVFELCAAYERQSYIEGMKTGARLMMKLAED